MKLHISFDQPDLERSLEIASTIINYAHVLEIGTIMLYKHGIKAVEAFRDKFPSTPLLVDSKIIDCGQETARLFAQADADWLTVMAGTNKNTIHMACTTAHKAGKKVMLDLLDTQSPGQSALEAKSLGVDALLFHQTINPKQSESFLEQWELVKGNTDLPIYLSAPFSREVLPFIISINPTGITVGKTIIEADDPQQEAHFFFEACTKD